MSDMIGTGLVWLEAQRTAHMSVSVTYARGATSDTLSATRGQTKFTAVDDSGAQMAGVAEDFIFTGADIVALLGGMPQPGDRITAGDDLFEVHAFGDDLRGWVWTDPYHISLRVHVVRIGEAA